jgi:hypothetical protein
MRIRHRTVLAVLCLVTSAQSLAAQRLRGQVVLPDSTTPVSGAIVLVTGDGGAPVGRALTNDRGTFDVAVGAAAHVDVRVLRIGFSPTVVTGVDVSAARALRIVANDNRNQLMAVTVRSRSECGLHSDSAAAVARVWEEARKALIASQLASDKPLVADWINYERNLDPNGSGVREQTVRAMHGATIHAFASQPAGKLASGGYVVEASNATDFYAPDADVMLSASFAATHCFSVEPAPAGRPELIGIGFTPTPERGDMKEIDGSFWLDRASAELRWIEFRYTNMLPAAEKAGAGGRVEFVRLKTGEWLVSSWNIVMAQAGAAAPSEIAQRKMLLIPTDAHLRALRVTGGELLSVSRGDSALYRGTGPSLRVQFVSRDHSMQLAGAEVALAGTDHRATADASGLAQIPLVLAGRYRARFGTPLMDSIGAVAIERDVDVRDGVAHVDSVALPGASDLVRTVCKDSHARIDMPQRAVPCESLRVASQQGTPAAQQGTPASAAVEITVTSRNGAALADATVDIAPWKGGKSTTVRTDATGHATVPAMDVGIVKVNARVIGYKQGEFMASVGAGRNTIPIILDAGRAPILDTIRVMCGNRVMSRYDQFETRRLNHQTTTSVSAAEIKDRNPGSLWEVLTRVPGVQVVDVPHFAGRAEDAVVATSKGAPPPPTFGTPRQTSMTTLQSMGAAPAACYLRVMINGAMQVPDNPQTGQSNLLRLPAPSTVYGVEVFGAGAPLPAELGVTGAMVPCGLISIWTK